MTAIYILSAVTVIFAVSCVCLRRKNRSFEGMICKFMASFGFLSVAVVGNYLNNGAHTKYFSLIVFALLFGFCGDVFLGIKEIAPSFRKKLIPLGTGYFFVGHIFYLLAFQTLYGMNYKILWFFVLGTVIGVAVIKLFKMQVGSAFTVILGLYCGLLILKIALSAFLVMQESNAANILTVIGSSLFLFSDSCIALLYFAHVKSKNAFVTAELSTYYAAQILLAMSVALR